jgi:hypothetical protein
MRFRSKKGGVVLKIVAVVAFILLVMSIEVPRRMWSEQAERKELARKRMVEMSDCEILYMQEKGSFGKDLKEVFNYAQNFNNLKLNAPDIDIEILDIDTTRIRLSFTQVKHFSDLSVLTNGVKEPENIEAKGKFIEFLAGIGCPTPDIVMDSDAEQIEILLKTNPHKDFYRSLKEKYYKSSENETEVLYNAGKSATIELKLRNPKLNLKSQKIILSSPSNINAVANYKGKKEIFWDFVSKDKIQIEIKKDPALVEQNVNMAKYVFTDIEEDKTPYLCPSTLDPFKVNFNLSAQVGMSVTFFSKDSKKLGNLTKDKEVINLTDNSTVQNYFLNVAKLKTERKVSDLVREYEMDGDSTYSSDKAKSELFVKFFEEQLRDLVAKEHLTDELKKSIDSPDYESEKRFSKIERFKVLFEANPGYDVAEEIKKEANKKHLSNVSFFYNTEIIKIDTVSVRIQSPINENSEFRGYERGFFQKKFLFGIADDENAGYVDNGSPSWRTE